MRKTMVTGSEEMASMQTSQNAMCVNRVFFCISQRMEKLRCRLTITRYLKRTVKHGALLVLKYCLGNFCVDIFQVFL